MTKTPHLKRYAGDRGNAVDHVYGWLAGLVDLLNVSLALYRDEVALLGQWRPGWQNPGPRDGVQLIAASAGAGYRVL